MTLHVPVPDKTTGAPTLRHVLREETRADHDAVDAVFAGFDLADRAAYGHFLTTHAAVLPTVEEQLAVAGLPLGPRRTTALRDDLTALGLPMPEPVAMALSGSAAWGALYVIEGSRLGGAMLARGVGAGLPRAYLSATHAPGAWRTTLAAIEQAAGDNAWREEAVAGAKAVFAAYHRAAIRECADG